MLATFKRIRPVPSLDTVLTDEMLARFDARSPQYDRDNRFFDEDFEELLQSGYLNIALPPEFGGLGLSLAEVAQLQRRLAYVAPATALAVNMHIYWVGLVADLYRGGDHSYDWLLEEAAAGHILAAGHGETGNDVPLTLSTTRAERVEGGWEFTGHKIFSSLSPVWTLLGLHGMDTSDPDHPQIVHAFLPRDSRGFTVKETWDTLGMRATQSNDTVLDRAFVPDSHVACVTPAGFAGANLFVLGVNAWALLNFAAIYQGVAERAFDLAVSSAKSKSSIALTRSMAYHPGVQHYIAEMRMALESIDAIVRRTTEDWASGVNHGVDWAVKIVTTKYTATNLAWQVVDTALDLSGGGGIFKRSRMEQLFRDARLGRIHPANTLLTHEVVGKISLGINPDEMPRWG